MQCKLNAGRPTTNSPQPNALTSLRNRSVPKAWEKTSHDNSVDDDEWLSAEALKRIKVKERKNIIFHKNFRARTYFGNVFSSPCNPVLVNLSWYRIGCLPSVRPLSFLKRLACFLLFPGGELLSLLFFYYS